MNYIYLESPNRVDVHFSSPQCLYESRRYLREHPPEGVEGLLGDPVHMGGNGQGPSFAWYRVSRRSEGRTSDTIFALYPRDQWPLTGEAMNHFRANPPATLPGERLSKTITCEPVEGNCWKVSSQRTFVNESVEQAAKQAVREVLLEHSDTFRKAAREALIEELEAVLADLQAR